MSFASEIHIQFDNAYGAGVRNFNCRIPVVNRRSNRMTVGMRAKELPKAEHIVSLQRHPAGFFRVAVESAFGMSCPDPLAGGALDVAGVPHDVLDGPEVRRHRGSLVISQADQYAIMGAGYDDSFRRVSGLDQDMQKLFVAQIAGVATRQTFLASATATH